MIILCLLDDWIVFILFVEDLTQVEQTCGYPAMNRMINIRIVYWASLLYLQIVSSITIIFFLILSFNKTRKLEAEFGKKISVASSPNNIPLRRMSPPPMLSNGLVNLTESPREWLICNNMSGNTKQNSADHIHHAASSREASDSSLICRSQDNVQFDKIKYRVKYHPNIMFILGALLILFIGSVFYHKTFSSIYCISLNFSV